MLPQAQPLAVTEPPSRSQATEPRRALRPADTVDARSKPRPEATEANSNKLAATAEQAVPSRAVTETLPRLLSNQAATELPRSLVTVPETVVPPPLEVTEPETVPLPEVTELETAPLLLVDTEPETALPLVDMELSNSRQVTVPSNSRRVTAPRDTKPQDTLPNNRQDTVPSSHLATELALATARTTRQSSQ